MAILNLVLYEGDVLETCNFLGSNVFIEFHSCNMLLFKTF